MITKNGKAVDSVSSCMTSKATYATPHLVIYGQVRALTQSGTKDGCEAVVASADKMASSCAGSDRGIKENIVAVGIHPSGIGLYLFDYKDAYRDVSGCGHGRQFGVMADEVATVFPEAVKWHPEGFKMVDYAVLGIERTLH